MPTYTLLKGAAEFGNNLISNQLEVNIADFFSWGLLNVGSFFNVNMPTSGVYGGDFSRLRPVKDPNFNDGQIWESARSNWVWESGLEYSQQPIRVSGITVNNTFYPQNTTGTYGHYIDYPKGRVVFNSAISTSSVVKAQYSYKWANFLTSNAPFFRDIQFRSARVDDSTFLQFASGYWSQLSQNRVQLPAVMIESTSRFSFTGMELGGGHYLDKDVLFYVMAETKWERNNLADMIAYQIDKKIFMYNVDLVAQNNKFPLTPLGSISSNALTYPQLIRETGDSGFRYKELIFKNVVGQEIGVDSQNLYLGLIRVTFQVRMPEI
jgi:hypothetical protein